MRQSISSLLPLSLLVGLLSAAACAPAFSTGSSPVPGRDPRVGLRGGRTDAAQALSNLRLLSNSPPTGPFLGGVNADLAFTGHYAIQGNFNGFQVWDISNPRRPVLKKAYYCPASQSDVSVYGNLLFVSGESTSGRLDCGGQGVPDTVSAERLRGLRIFDITDIGDPRYVANVQTCRGSHTHTVVEDPRDRANVYVYISGSADVRSPNELAGCVSAAPDQDPNSSLFRIEVIRVPVAHPERAAIVTTPRIFTGLSAPPVHGDAPEDVAAAAKAVADVRARGGFTAVVRGVESVLSQGLTQPLLDSIVRARGGSGVPTGADSAALRADVQRLVDRMFGAPSAPSTGPTQCHDITVYPAIGLAGGACGGYGLLLDIRDPAHPVRIGAVADSNFAYWHSATFNNDGTKILFTDEWGGGRAAKCRATDKREWGANAIFTLEGNAMVFRSYYKLPAEQSPSENCVAHNGSLIPIPGRDVMVQAWYQGGISVFDWTDPAKAMEIAFFDRGPVGSALELGGSWSVYWYNGAMYSSEITRGLDVVELTPSEFISRNEIDAAKTVHYDHLNAQGQPKMVWPPSFALARAYLDQLERSRCLAAGRLSEVRAGLASAERGSGARRHEALAQIATRLAADARESCDAPKVRTLEGAVRDLADIPT